MDENNVSGSLVLYKSKPEMFIKAIDSFFSCSSCKQLVIVDNSPTEELITYLKINYFDYIEQGELLCFHLPQNPGYGYSHNYAISQRTVNAPYHVILNPDVFFPSRVVSELIRVMKTDLSVGLIMPKVLGPDHSVQKLCKCLPTPFDLFVRRFIPLASVNNCFNDKYENRTFSYNSTANVPYLSGCFMFLRSSVFQEVGGFDERFFMYPEDLDLTRRIHKHYKTLYYPKVTIIHDHAKESYKSIKMTWIHIVNMVKYFNKWGWFFDKDRKQINKDLIEELRNK